MFKSIAAPSRHYFLITGPFLSIQKGVACSYQPAQLAKPLIGTAPLDFWLHLTFTNLYCFYSHTMVIAGHVPYRRLWLVYARSGAAPSLCMLWAMPAALVFVKTKREMIKLPTFC
jgi:hypothetical protein